MVGIYKIINPTNKVYIGQSWNIEQRKKQYSKLRCKKQPMLYNSLKKYGWEKHQWEIIEELNENVNQKYLDQCEIKHWKQYVDEGFEMMNIREPGYGGKQNIISKEKISKALKGKPKPVGFGKIISLKTKGQITSEETKEKIRIANTGKKRTEEQINKLRIIRTEEFKMSLRGKKKPPRTEGHKLNLSLSLKGNGKGKPKPDGFGEMISKVKSKPVIQYNLEGEFVKEWKNKKEAEMAMNCRHIRCIINKDNRTAMGFVWKYKH